jgi:uncharacterized protein YbjT (DUF2867 family)
MDAPVLLTGASGYIGGRLLRRFERGGRAVRCLARQPSRLNATALATEIVQGDCLDEHSLERALAGVHTAYYLVHSMGRGANFAAVDRRAAENFARAAQRAAVKRIIYLGGLTDEASSLSTHLKSRIETGEILRVSGVPVIEFRASVVIGAGSLSFEMIQALVERLPVMICPRWVDTLTQPIAIDDVLAYLEAALDAPSDNRRHFRDGGPEVVSYGDMMRRFGRFRGLRRLLLPVPVLTPHLSGLWLALVTPAQARVGRALVESLKNSTSSDRRPHARRSRSRRRRSRRPSSRRIDDGTRARLKIDTRTVVVDEPPAAGVCADSAHRGHDRVVLRKCALACERMGRSMVRRHWNEPRAARCRRVRGRRHDRRMDRGGVRTRSPASIVGRSETARSRLAGSSTSRRSDDGNGR